MFNNLFGFGRTGHAYEEITPHQLEQKRSGAEPVQIIDVREPYEYREGHIPGSKLIPLGQLSRRLNELGPRDREVIVVCRSGNRSGQAAHQLAGLGYSKVVNLHGGMMSWHRAGLPSER
jgi:rhodanese-related sulfurtransferase